MSGINGVGGNGDLARVLAEMRNHAAQAQGGQAEEASKVAGSDFSSMLKQSVDKVNELQQASKANVTAFEMGDPNVSLADAMVSMQKASIAFQAMSQVRNKVVQAYQEVMSMPV